MSPVFFRERIVDVAARYRLPVMCGLKEFATAGGLMAFGVNLPEMFRRSADYVDKIVRGAKPADLPVETPTKFELVVNLKTAKTLGLTIPPSLLARADQVIE
jgi:putative ABC transport system substrate-binding protein